MKLTFVNVEATPVIIEMEVEKSAVALIVRWYGGFHAGDSYKVLVDGKVVAIDRDGELVDVEPLT